MKELSYFQDKTGPPSVFDKAFGGLKLEWMHPSVLKAIRGVTAAGAFAFVAGCETTAQTETGPKETVIVAQQTPQPPAAGPSPTPVATNAAPTPPQALATPASAPSAALGETNLTDGVATTNATLEITDEVPPTIPSDLKLNDEVEKVIKLAQSGVDEKVLLAFVEKSAAKFELDADEILYLSDVGVPSAVITAMLKHDGDDPSKAEVLTTAPDTESSQPELAAPASAPATIPQPTQQQVAETATNATPSVVAQAPPPQTVVVQQPAQTVVVQQPESVTYFYSSLAPYGSWFYVADYGWCWQPTVAVVDHGWRPYGHRGRWVWTTAGWYWHSDYSWGWAPFHYGRWHLAGPRGWIWVPDRTWGPAWVTWRSTPDYCGWAPLPPAAHYRSGFGFTYYGRGVDINFGFGLGYDAFCFVPVHRFHHRRVYDYCAPRWESRHHFQRSHVENHYEFRGDRDHNHHFVNRGVARTTPHNTRPAEIRETRTDSRERVDRRDGRDQAVWRPVNASGNANFTVRGGQNMPGAQRPSNRPAPTTSTASPGATPQSRGDFGGRETPRSRAEVTSRPVSRPEISTLPIRQAGDPVTVDRSRGRTPAPQVIQTPANPRPAPNLAPAPAPTVVRAPTATTPRITPQANPTPLRPAEVSSSPFSNPGAPRPAGQPQVINPANRQPTVVYSTPAPKQEPALRPSPAPAQPRIVTPAPAPAPVVRSAPVAPVVTAPPISRSSPPASVAPAPQVQSPPARNYAAPPTVAPRISAPAQSQPPTVFRAPAPSNPSPAPVVRSSPAPAANSAPVTRSEPRAAGAPTQVSPANRGRRE